MPSSFEFLRHALRRQEAQIWKKALDGLAMAESIEAIEGMDNVLSSVTDDQKRAWIEEAISNTKAALNH